MRIHPLPFLLLLLGFAGATPAPASDRPNIIFIMADDLGYGNLGSFGSDSIRTPHLDRLAKQGTRFTQYYSGSPVCAPARSVLMTGLHTGHTRIRDNGPQEGGRIEAFDEGREGGVRLSFTADQHTVATALRDAGYTTGISGKWGLGEPGTEGTPNRHGFDEWLGYLNQNHAAYYYTDYLDENEGRREIPENAGGRERVYSNDVFSDFAIDFVRRHRDGPFFLYLPYTIPHNRMEVPDLGEYADRGWPEDARIYAAMVTRLDGYVGRLMAELDRIGLADDTLVMFTSDNGALGGQRADVLNSNAALRGAKSTLYEGGIRVPLIVRWPGVVEAGGTDDTIWGFADMFPTFASLAGARIPEGLDGLDASAVLRGKSPGAFRNRALYWEFPRNRLWQAVREGRWKGIRYGTDQPLELYDLEEDPFEQRDVAAANSEVVTRLERFLDSSHVPSPHWPVQ